MEDVKTAVVPDDGDQYVLSLCSALSALVEADRDLAQAVNFCEPTERLDELMVAEGASRAARSRAEAVLAAIESCAAAPAPLPGGLGAVAQEALLPTEDAVLADKGREAIWKVVHEVWQLLDDGETDSAGVTTIEQDRLRAVSEAMDALEALVPDSAGPFWGGFPVNYFWPKGSGQ